MECFINMELDFNSDVACLDADLLQLPEVAPLAIKDNPCVAEKLFDQWLSLPDTGSLVYLYAWLNDLDFYCLPCCERLNCIICNQVHLFLCKYKCCFVAWFIHLGC